MTRAGWTVLAVTCALEGAAIVLGFRPGRDGASVVIGIVAVTGVLLLLAMFGALIVARHRSNAVGWLFCSIALALALTNFGTEYGRHALRHPGSLPAGRWLAWVGSWATVGTAPLAGTVLLLLFPTGRLPSRRWRPVLWFSIASLVALTVSLMLTRESLVSVTSLDNPAGVLPKQVGMVGGLLIPAVVLSCASLVARYRAAAGDERQQLRWMAAAGVFFLVSVGVGLTYDAVTGQARGWPMLIGAAALVVAAGTAVMRHRLYDLDLVVNRSLVYGSLTAVVLAGSVGIVAGLGALIGSRLGASLIATALVAVAVQPLRARLQRRVDRLMYGDRHDPYRALARLGERLGRALDPAAVLPSIVESVSEGLRVPYAAIELDGRVVARHGRSRGGDPVRLPLAYRGVALGQLVVAPRAASEPLSTADLRLLGDLARHAGVAVHAVRLTYDLRRSRERLVNAREEERRRLRRDLHDGLGPTLAGIALEIEAALALLERDPSEARTLLSGVKDEAQHAIADIRRIAHDLRPPSLDELGLVAALREHAARLGVTPPGGTHLDVAVEAPADLPVLPAAVEVAAYRIALEALTNVSRHARATRCVVELSLNGSLELEIRDDGCGLAPAVPGGIGIISMRERAEELGGSLLVAAAASGPGTIVRASLPVESA